MKVAMPDKPQPLVIKQAEDLKRFHRITARLEARNAELRGALRSHGVHRGYCQLLAGAEQQCTCGLAEALKDE
jgi:hypothetical protein